MWYKYNTGLGCTKVVHHRHTYYLHQSSAAPIQCMIAMHQYSADYVGYVSKCLLRYSVV